MSSSCNNVEDEIPTSKLSSRSYANEPGSYCSGLFRGTCKTSRTEGCMQMIPGIAKINSVKWENFPGKSFATLSNQFLGNQLEVKYWSDG